MRYFYRRTSIFASTATLLGSLALSTMPGALAAELGPAENTLEKPVPAPVSAPAPPAPEVQQSIAVPRPGSVSDEEYATEQEAAKTGPAPAGAVALPVPPGAEAVTAPSNAAKVTVSFPGLTRQTAVNNGAVFIPPDTILGKSPNRAIEATNSAIRMFALPGGILFTADLNTFFGTIAPDGRLFDPKVYYDRNATNPRVYVVALQKTGNVSRLWVAVSRSSDPVNLTTNWCRYNIDARGEIGTANESWGDYPAIGAGRDSFSIALNNLRFTDSAFRFARIHVFNKNILSNNAVACPTVPRFVVQPAAAAGDFGLFTIQPAQHYTSPSSAPGTVNPAYYLSTRRGSSNQYFVHRIRNVASGAPTYTRVTLTSLPYGIPPAGTQPGTALLIDSGDNRMLQVAGIGSGDMIVGIFTTICKFTLGNVSCTLTPRVLVAIGPGGALMATLRENTFAGFGDNIFVHHPSIAIDAALRLGSTWEFNGANFPLSSAAMTKVVFAKWVGVQTYAPGACPDLLVDASGRVRSGDFSGAQLDPNGSGFWLAGEQAILIVGTCQWQTRVVMLTP